MLINLKGLAGFSLGVLLLFTGVSCSKDEDKPASKTDLLTSKPWKLIAETYHGDFNGDGIPESTDTDIYALLEACEKDNTIKFNTDGSGIADEGPLKCDATDPQTESIDWLFKENETIIKIVQDILALDFKILELTATTLKVEYTDTIYGSGDVITMTYSH